MMLFNSMKKLFDALIYLSSLFTAIKTALFCYKWCKNHKDEIIDACLKILDYFWPFKKKSYINKLKYKETPLWNTMEFKNTIIWI